MGYYKGRGKIGGLGREEIRIGNDRGRANKDLRRVVEGLGRVRKGSGMVKQTRIYLGRVKIANGNVRCLFSFFFYIFPTLVRNSRIYLNFLFPQYHPLIYGWKANMAEDDAIVAVVVGIYAGATASLTAPCLQTCGPRACSSRTLVPGRPSILRPTLCATAGTRLHPHQQVLNVQMHILQ